MHALDADGNAAEVLSDLPTTARELGDFRLIGEIGRGGMGVVYEAEQISLGRKVALKILPFAAMLDARQLARFRNKARAAAVLHHTNIVPIHSVGCERGVHFYAMQLITGDSFARVIQQLRSENGLADDEDHKPEIGVRKPEVGVASIHTALPDDSAPTSEWVANSAPSPLREEGRGEGAADTVPVVHAFLSTARSASSKTYFRTVAQLGIQAAEALDYAHEQASSIATSSPPTCCWTTRGNLWITDFGLAQL